MTLKKSSARAAQKARDRHNTEMAAKAAAVASAVFPGAPPNQNLLRIRTAIGLNFVLLCDKQFGDTGYDIDEAVRAVTRGAADYDQKRDGASDWMRWWGDVKAHRVREEMVRLGTESTG